MLLLLPLTLFTLLEKKVYIYHYNNVHAKFVYGRDVYYLC